MSNPSLFSKCTNSNPLYRVWYGMKRRCREQGTKDSHRYVNRGITYSLEWNSFKQFYLDMAPGYKPGLSLDRIDNDRGYSAPNCRWATPKQQANNRSSNRKITISGVTRTLSQWAEQSSIKSSTIRQRFYVYGWPIEKALGLTKKEGY